MPLPLGIVGSEGKQLDVYYLLNVLGGTSANKFFGLSIDGQGSTYTTNPENAYMLKQYFNGIRDWVIQPPLSDWNQYTQIPFTTDNNGNTYTINFNNDVTKIDTYGTVVWKYRYSVPNVSSTNYRVMSITTDPSGNVYFTRPYELISPQYGSGIYVTKINSNGDIIWSQKLDFTYANWNQNGEVTRTSISVNESGTTYSIFVRDYWTLFQFSGSTTSGIFSYWHRGALAYNYGTPSCVTDTNGNTYFITTASATNGGTAYTYLVKISFNGSTIWARKIYANSSDTYTNAGKIRISADYNYLYLTCSGYGSTNRLMFMKFDLSGNLLWCNSMVTNYPIPDFIDMVVSPVRGFALIANVNTSTGVMYKLPTDGSGQSTTTINTQTYTYSSFTPVIDNYTFNWTGDQYFAEVNTQSQNTATVKTSQTSSYTERTGYSTRTYLLGS